MTRYLEIAVLSSAPKPVFHYHLPEDWDPLETGRLVVVPFGSQTVQGIVLGPVAHPGVPETRAVEAVLDPLPVLTPVQIHLAKWMAGYYRASLDACLSAMLPPGLARHAEGLYRLAAPSFRADRPVARRLIKLLAERGPLRSGQIRTAFGPLEWQREAERLVRAGVVQRKSILPPPAVRPKKIRLAQSAISGPEAGRAMAALRVNSIPANRRAAAERRARVLEALSAEGRPLAVDWIYASSGAGLADLKWLAEAGWVDLVYEEELRDPLSGRNFPRPEPLVPTDEQAEAVDAIAGAVSGRRAEDFLLYGITGSGKTEVYLRAAESAVRCGRRAIVLVPEIALTPQMVQRFGARFPGRLGLVHSRLSPGERYDVWRRARAGALDVVLGPRSALFSPLPDIGLIVLDEEHDSSYKSGSTPCYHARETAREYARSLPAACVLGSATPDLVTFHRAERGAIRLLPLTRRVSAEMSAGTAPELPPVEIADMRRELSAGNRSMFSRALSAALEDCLGRNEQAILFLNRRGVASAVVCRTCGKAVDCPRCSIPLTSHGEFLLCHHCNYRRGIPAKCPVCGSPAIRPLGVGTRQVEAEVRRLFPKARTLRWDRDAVAAAGEHDILLEHFASHRADVLIGTQMIAKGLDLPEVTLVGIVLAELGLLLPDYRSPERVFQTLMQVAGRAGRSDRPGRVVLQTYMPEQSALQCAAAHDYPRFFRLESGQRRALGYPPFQQLVRLVFAHIDEAAARANAEALAVTLRARIVERGLRDASLAGPVPCFFSKIGGRFRWQIVLRGPDPGVLVDQPLPDGWRVDVDPVSML
jgi:primosomal protein N' (replication factor Y)